MKLRALIVSEKVITSHGTWATGKMPRSAFPLSKSGTKAYKLGNRRWRVVAFDVCGATCRLLINYSHALGQFQAMLGVQHGGDTKVLGTLELHPTHGGWHAHVGCDSKDVPAGIRRGPWIRRMSGSKGCYSRKCPETDDEAYRMAVDFFRLDKTPGGGGLL